MGCLPALSSYPVSSHSASHGRGVSPCRGYDGKFKFGILPVATFCSGHTFFVQRMPAKLGLDAYVAHATFQYSGTPGKRHRFREALLWNVSAASLTTRLDATACEPLLLLLLLPSPLLLLPPPPLPLLPPPLLLHMEVLGLSGR